MPISYSRTFYPISGASGAVGIPLRRTKWTFLVRRTGSGSLGAVQLRTRHICHWFTYYSDIHVHIAANTAKTPPQYYYGQNA